MLLTIEPVGPFAVVGAGERWAVTNPTVTEEQIALDVIEWADSRGEALMLAHAMEGD